MSTVGVNSIITPCTTDKLILTLRRRRLLKYSPSVYVVKCRFLMNSLSVPFGRRSLWTPLSQIPLKPNAENSA